MNYLFLGIFIIVTAISLLIFRGRAQREYKDINRATFLQHNNENLNLVAESIAREHKEVDKNSRKNIGEFLENIDEMYNQILDSYRVYYKDNEGIFENIKGCQWILENVYLVEKEYKEVRKSLTKRNLKKLPILKSGILKGYPRIYAVAKKLLEFYKGNVDEEKIITFLLEYEKITILTMAELESLPAMLETVYLDFISTSTYIITNNIKERLQGEKIGEDLIKYSNDNNKEKIKEILKNKKISYTENLAYGIIKMLENQDIENDFISTWLEDILREKEINKERLFIYLYNLEGRASFTISESLSHLRTVKNLNLQRIFESTSKVEEILKEDPLGVYEFMDLPSKCQYRHMIEKIARENDLPEIFIASKATQCAWGKKDYEYENHVGFYLIDEGRRSLNKALYIDFKGFEKLKDRLKGRSVAIYLTTIGIFIFLFLSLFLTLSYFNDDNVMIIKYVLVALVILIPTSEVIISILNWIITHLSCPKTLPKLDFSKGIPLKCKTTIIIPVIIDSNDNAKKLLQRIESYYLGNRDNNIYFTILADFKDSDYEVEESDKNIEEFCLEEINKLNRKYKDKRFFFFCRKRLFNSEEGKWIGWERKRGKVEEFNRLLMDLGDTTFTIKSQGYEILKGSQYVITLDGDTMIPRDVAKVLIGAMAHPLNKAYLDKDGKILRGYGIMQPRIAIDMVSANKTYFSRVFSGEVGADLYTRAVSDLYQDLFEEGIFTGKAIYNLSVFTRVMEGKIEENTVLSHDLLEGSFARTALLTDVELIDGYPSNLISSGKRLHRWVRGDWQLLPYIFGKNQLNRLSRWKIFDNLRRSLVAPSMVVLLLCSLGKILPNGIEKWYMVAFISLITPILFDVSEQVVEPLKSMSLSGRIKGIQMVMKQVFFIYVFLPFKAFLMVDAIARTIYRMFHSKKNLLQWQTAASVENKIKNNIKVYINYMWIEPVISIIIAFLALMAGEKTFFTLLPSCILWFLSPNIAYLMGITLDDGKISLKSEENSLLRRMGRKIWAYYEDTVNEETNYLGGDNYQEVPHKGIALRTSPTNMGMVIAANVSAWDLGYIGPMELVKNLENTINSLKKLERYKGNFYNWYDVSTLKPLEPKYVSTVDSGNLLADLYIVEEVLEEMQNERYYNYREKGLKDLIDISMENSNSEHRTNFIYTTIMTHAEKSENICDYYRNLKKLQSFIEEVGEDLDYWKQKLKSKVDLEIQELTNLFPVLKTTKAIKEIEKTKLIEILSDSTLKELADEDFLKKLDNIVFDKELRESIAADMKTTNEKFEDLMEKIKELQEEFRIFIKDMNLRFLYDEERSFFHIGYDLQQGKLSDNYYDLLASEARITSFLAIGRGEVPTTHWYKLSRAMTKVEGKTLLASWSGTMFEYFMPKLLLKTYEKSLWDETYESVSIAQISYGKRKEIPFGISESGYYKFDMDLNYQYKAFGVPGVGICPGLEKELVISPYSVFISMEENIPKAIRNIEKLIDMGVGGKYGLYEALDYTQGRMKNREYEIVKSFMTHHQGMSILALDNVLNNKVMVKRFHSIPMVKATEILLQERKSRNVIFTRKEEENQKSEQQFTNMYHRDYEKISISRPELLLLGNPSFNLVLESGGGSSTKLNNNLLYRWRKELPNRHYGMFFYVKDEENREYTSTTYEPCKNYGDSYKVNYYLDKGQYIKTWGNLEMVTEVRLLEEENCEIRRVKIKNLGEKTRKVQVTSYCEVTLQSYEGDLSHPAFGNLFITTEYEDNLKGILARRRKRSEGEEETYLFQTCYTKSQGNSQVQYETSRIDFIGRNGSMEKPGIMEKDEFEGKVGNVLDPIISLRKSIEIKSGDTEELIYLTVVGPSKKKVLAVAFMYEEIKLLKLDMERQNFLITEGAIKKGLKNLDIALYEKVASHIIFSMESKEKKLVDIENLGFGKEELWKYGISGDMPIVTLFMERDIECYILQQIIDCHNYIEGKGVNFDIVVINEEGNSYDRPLLTTLHQIILNSHLVGRENSKGGIYLLDRNSMEEKEVNVLKVISSLVFYGKDGWLIKQIKKYDSDMTLVRKEKKVKESEENTLEKEDLKFYNGYGGFNDKGEYTIFLSKKANTPMPWINVISNGNFGFTIGESGSGYTWFKNSREFKVTPWNNDFVEDTLSELIYFQEDEEYFSIMPKPFKDAGDYKIVHGFGYSEFTHETKEILGKAMTFVSVDKNIKFVLLRLKNCQNKSRRIKVTYAAVPALGDSREHTGRGVYIEKNNDKKYIYGRNVLDKNFRDVYAYIKMVGVKEVSFIDDLAELYYEKSGDGEIVSPLLGEEGYIRMEPDEEKSLVLLLGVEESIEAMEETIENINIEYALEELEKMKVFWQEHLGKIKISTGNEDLDLMINGWLPYETLSCRIFSRTAFYQCGGAYGFRDQLQDVLAMMYIEPNLTRKQILLSASRQFEEGDVQHWWHPILNSGIRTKFSDDLLWLPYVTAKYVKTTGDFKILEEKVNYLHGEELEDNVDERYSVYEESQLKESLYDHCVKAIDKALKFGAHGLPLMGSGDWNDGMNKVGNQGRGESVWLGWFLYSVLDEFKEIAIKNKDYEYADNCQSQMEAVKKNLDEHGWDGLWYKRAYFDSGKPLGSKENEECTIDSISQCWAAISQGGNLEKTNAAMDSLMEMLVNREEKLVRLLWPPFKDTDLNPGYIKGYVPGVRENGGQYSHGAAWTVLALIKLGRIEEAYEIYSMLNPINHGLNKEEAEKFKTEPYVMAADIYSVEPHVGRGGWSWYTGSSGWMYTIGLNYILGFQIIEGKTIEINPSLPKAIDGYNLEYKFNKYLYHIEVKRGPEKETQLDNKVLKENSIPLIEGEHWIKAIFN